MTGSLHDRLIAAGFRGAEAARRAAVFAPVEAAIGADGRQWAFEHVPGRIEVFGKHTDYAGGRSLVCTTQQGIAVAFAPRTDALLTLVDAARGERREVPIAPGLAAPRGDWVNYPMTVASRLARDFGPLHGVDLVFASDLPLAAGLSSSSALVVAVARALIDQNRLTESPIWRRTLMTTEDLGGYLGAVENGRPFAGFEGGGGVGTMGGSQDQTAILCARPDALIQIRFDPVELEQVVPWPADLSFAIAASGVVAEKAAGALELYNDLATLTARLRELVVPPGDRTTTLGRSIIDPADPTESLAASFSRIAALEDQRLGERLRNRLIQLVAECRTIIPGAAAALRRNDRECLGQMALASQRGAEAGLGNQIPETIDLVESAVRLGAVGASAFGAGFGGSVWAAVDSGHAEAFAREWEAGYRARFPDRTAVQVHLTRPSPPAVRL